MNDQRFDDSTQKAIDKIEKLMRLAGSNPNEAEAASALAKAQELLTAYNLDMSVVEQGGGTKSGKRASEMVAGGHHKYQRQLWRSIAELNFCFYWSQKNRVTDETRWYAAQKWIHQHRVVGRTINVVTTKNMAEYLEATIYRLCSEKFLTTNYFKLSGADPLSYREGIADRVIEKIEERRRDMVRAEERKAREDAMRASAAGHSLATALTIAGLTEREEQANYDFLHGDGAFARKKAAEEAFEKDWQARRKRQAAAEAAAEKEYSAWAAANPEEAAREEKKQRAKERAQERRDAMRRPRQRYFRESAEDIRKASGAYHAGYAKGSEVSIEPQVAKAGPLRIAK